MKSGFQYNLKELRTRKNLSISKFANLIGVTASTLNKYESGAAIPKINTLEVICKVLDCSPTEILNKSDGVTITDVAKKCALLINKMEASQQAWTLLTLEGLELRLKEKAQISLLTDEFIDSLISK